MSQLGGSLFLPLLYGFISSLFTTVGAQKKKGYVRSQVLFVNDTTHSLLTVKNDKNLSTQITWPSFLSFLVTIFYTETFLAKGVYGGWNLNDVLISTLFLYIIMTKEL